MMMAQVLCMEYVEGIKINDVAAIERAGVDRALLSTRTAECYLEQLIRHGFFHCDPHPGRTPKQSSPHMTCTFFFSSLFSRSVICFFVLLVNCPHR